MGRTCSKKEGENLLFFIIIPFKNGLSSILNVGFCGFFVYTKLTYMGETATADELKWLVEKGKLETVRWGAVLYFIAALHATAAAFADVIGLKFKK